MDKTITTSTSILISINFDKPEPNNKTQSDPQSIKSQNNPNFGSLAQNDQADLFGNFGFDNTKVNSQNQGNNQFNQIQNYADNSFSNNIPQTVSNPFQQNTSLNNQPVQNLWNQNMPPRPQQPQTWTQNANGYVPQQQNGFNQNQNVPQYPQQTSGMNQNVYQSPGQVQFNQAQTNLQNQYQADLNNQKTYSNYFQGPPQQGQQFVQAPGVPLKQPGTQPQIPKPPVSPVDDDDFLSF
jgi:hypothetical protein